MGGESARGGMMGGEEGMSDVRGECEGMGWWEGMRGCERRVTKWGMREECEGVEECR